EDEPETTEWDTDTMDWDSEAEDATDWDSLWDESVQDTAAVAYDWDEDGSWEGYADSSSWDSYDYDDGGYWETYQANLRKKDSLSTEWVSEYVTGVISETPAQNILSNSSYRKSLNSGMLASLWIPDLGLMYDQFILSVLGNRNPFTSPIGFGSLQAGVYADKE